MRTITVRPKHKLRPHQRRYPVKGIFRIHIAGAGWVKSLGITGVSCTPYIDKALDFSAGAATTGWPEMRAFLNQQYKGYRVTIWRRVLLEELP